METLNIVYLDAHTLNPGDLEWGPLAALGHLQVYPRSTPAEAAQRAATADILLVNKFVVDEAALQAMPRVRAVVVTATGCNNVDAEAVQRRGIVVCNAVGYGAAAVAQHAFALLLALTNRVQEYHQSVQRGDWSAQPDFCYLREPPRRTGGKNFGVDWLGENWQPSGHHRAGVRDAGVGLSGATGKGRSRGRRLGPH